MLRAVTYDYWRTLIWEPTGELERMRILHWTRILASRGLVVSVEAVAEAHAQAFALASASWRRNEQFLVEDAADVMVRHLALDIDPTTRGDLIAAFSQAGLETRLEEAPSIRHGLGQLKDAGLKIGIVCDVGLTPSPVLIEHLQARDLLRYFDHWSFSDRVGEYKPSPRPFQHACDGLRVDAAETAHVGDQRRTDIAGAHAAGLLAVRYAGVFDDQDESIGEADVVLTDHAEIATALGLA